MHQIAYVELSKCKNFLVWEGDTREFLQNLVFKTNDPVHTFSDIWSTVYPKFKKKTQFHSLLYTRVDAWGTSHVGWGIFKLCGEEEEGVLGFKISYLVHTLGAFDDVQPLRKELEGKGVGGGIPLPHQGIFAF